MSIEKYIATIIEREGGYVDHPDDKGGPTKFGITLKTLQEIKGSQMNAADIAELSPEDAYKIYKENYLVKPGIINIKDYKLQALMLDAAINHGASRAIKFLQKILCVQEDGIIGSITIQMANSFSNPDLLRKKYICARIKFYGAIVNKDHTQAVFIEGWLNRSCDLLETLV